MWKDGKQVTEPAPEVRLGGIYAVERISQDSTRDHIQIMEILCAYIGQNAPAPEARPNPHEVFRDLVEGGPDRPPLKEDEAGHSEDFQAVCAYGGSPTDMTIENMVRYLQRAPGARLDIQAALTVIGRRSEAASRKRATHPTTASISEKRTGKPRTLELPVSPARTLAAPVWRAPA